MAASKLEKRLYKLVHKLATRFNAVMFFWTSNQATLVAIINVQTGRNRKKSEVDN